MRLPHHSTMPKTSHLEHHPSQILIPFAFPSSSFVPDPQTLSNEAEDLPYIRRPHNILSHARVLRAELSTFIHVFEKSQPKLRIFFAQRFVFRHRNAAPVFTDKVTNKCSADITKCRVIRRVIKDALDDMRSRSFL